MRWIACVVLLGGAAQAQVFSDDFESSPGPWTDIAVEPSMTVAPDPSAAHRGDAGLLVADPLDGGADAGEEGYVEYVYPPGFSPAQYYVRGWVRVPPKVAYPGSMRLFQFHADGGAGQDLGLNVRFDAQTSALLLYGQDATGAVRSGAINNANPPGWYLIEFWVEGWGVDAGFMNWALQGVKPAPAGVQNIDLTGLSLSALRVGEVEPDNDDWTGSIAFDDVRTSLTQSASRVAVDAGTPSGVVGNCVPAAVWMYASTDAIASPPYAFSAALTSDDPGARFFTDATCGDAGTAVAVTDAGTPFGVIFSQSGAVRVTASYVDFVSFPLTFQISPASDAGVVTDGGFDGGEGGTFDGGELTDAGLGWTVACGCDGAHVPAMLWVLLLGLLYPCAGRMRWRSASK